MRRTLSVCAPFPFSASTAAANHQRRKKATLASLSSVCDARTMARASTRKSRFSRHRASRTVSKPGKEPLINGPDMSRGEETRAQTRKLRICGTSLSPQTLVPCRVLRPQIRQSRQSCQKTGLTKSDVAYLQGLNILLAGHGSFETPPLVTVDGSRQAALARLSLANHLEPITGYASY